MAPTPRLILGAIERLLAGAPLAKRLARPVYYEWQNLRYRGLVRRNHVLKDTVRSLCAPRWCSHTARQRRGCPHRYVLANGGVLSRSQRGEERTAPSLFRVGESLPGPRYHLVSQCNGVQILNVVPPSFESPIYSPIRWSAVREVRLRRSPRDASKRTPDLERPQEGMILSEDVIPSIE